MNDKTLYEILKDKEYYNIVAMIMACDSSPIQSPLQEWIGIKSAFDVMRRVVGFIGFAQQTNLSKNPIALTPCGHIYRDHFQLAGAFLAKKYSIGTITKKIPCEFEIFNKNWAISHFSPKNFELVDNYYDKLLVFLSEKV